MKTPEELAEEYAPTFEDIMKQYTEQWDGCPYILGSTKGITAVTLAYGDGYGSGFLAGYQAGRSNSEVVQAAAPQWISVKDRLPEEDGPILVWSGRLEDVPTCAAAGYELWNWSIEYSPHDYRLFELSHWMPLPKKPEE